MSESEEKRLTSISKAQTLDEIADFWDQTQEVEFEVRAKRRQRVTLDPELYARIEAQARVRGISPETLINMWLAERLQEVGSSGE